MIRSQTVDYGIKLTDSSAFAVPIEHEYYTNFKWTFPHWFSLLHTINPGTILLSDSFKVNGIDDCTCQLSVKPQDPNNQSLIVEFSDSVDVIGMNIILSVTSNQFKRFYLHPVDKVIIFLGSCLSSKGCDLNNHLKNNVHGSKSLSIEVWFEVTKFPKLDKINSLKPYSNVIKSMEYLFDKKAFCDITFVFIDKELTAHKNILAARSKVFEAMFSSEMKEKDTGRVEIDDSTAEVFEAFLKHLYTGETNDLKNIVDEILLVADKYEVSDLKEWCEDYMLKNLLEKNVVKYLLIADKVCCTKLKKKALEILRCRCNAWIEAITNENIESFVALRQIISNDASKK